MPLTMFSTTNTSSNIDSRVQSPRPGTPEPSSRQGRRNTQPDAQLLDDDGAISQKVRDGSVLFAMLRLTHEGCTVLVGSVSETHLHEILYACPTCGFAQGIWSFAACTSRGCISYAGRIGRVGTRHEWRAVLPRDQGRTRRVSRCD